jgi:DNA-binding transcriptional MerR regulator
MMQARAASSMKVGELARRTGVSVRTLHFYDEIGLLSPAERTASGHRLYGPREIERLQQIASLRALGLSLDEVRDFLTGGDSSLLNTIEMHADRLRAQITLQRDLLARLDAISRYLQTNEHASTDDLLDAMEMMHMVESHFTPEQLEWLQKRREEVGEERIREVEAEWPRLMAEVRNEMENGTDPAHPRVQALMTRWRGLVAEFTGGNPEIAQSLNRMYEEEPEVRTRAGGDDALFEYVGKAMAASNAP